MIANDFAYVRPDSVDEALLLLSTPGARIMAGGQNLVPLLAERFVNATLLVDISRIETLRHVSVTPEWLRIGAAATLSSLMSVEVAISAPLLHAVLPSVASRAVRNRGTLGGNLVVAHPNSELPVALYALGAQVVLRNATGDRTLPIDEFIVGPRITAIASNELLYEVRIPLAPAGQTIGAFSEIAPRSSALPHASVAASLRVDAHCIVRAAGIVAGGVEDVPARCCAHEAAILDKPLSDSVDLLSAVGDSGLVPSSNLAESAYALDVLPTLIHRAVVSAATQFRRDDDGANRV
jgi:CO/xanthine dehydrogenase FAD-binding subunit